MTELIDAIRLAARRAYLRMRIAAADSDRRFMLQELQHALETVPAQAELHAQCIEQWQRELRALGHEPGRQHTAS